MAWTRVRPDRRLLAAVLPAALALVALLPALPASAASAATAASAASAASTTTATQTATFNFTQLGLSDSYRFAGNGAAIGIRLPVPRALTPSALVGTLVVPPDFGTGTVVVQSGTHYVGSFELPPSSAGQQRVPFLMSVADAPVIGQYANLTLTIEQANGGALAARSATCGGSALPLELADPSVIYAGTFQQPTSIATFFPPVLDQLILYVPPTPTPAEEATALTVASAAVLEYHLVPTTVVVRSWSGSGLPPAPTLPLDRAVAIEQTSGAGRVTMPAVPTGDNLMVLSGSAGTLPAQGTLLTNQISKVVETRSATVTHAFTAPVLGQSEQTFSQLGLAGSATFSGEQQLTFDLSEAQLGGLVSSVTVDLKGDYTPVEAGAKATASVSVNGDVLGEAELTPSGKVTLPITIPGALVSRSTTVSLALTYFPAGFSCGSTGRTMTFTVDPRSTVIPTFAGGGHGGFTALPQALFPSFQVAFDKATAARLTAAVQTICGLQRITPVGLNLAVVPMSTALADHVPVLVVSATPSVQKALDPPLKAGGRIHYDVSGTTNGTVAMSAAVASLQVFDQTSQARTVMLVTTTGSWTLPGRLFSWLGDTPTKWAGLNGDVLAAGTKGTPADLTVRVSGTGVLAAPQQSRTTTIVLGVVALFLVALVLLAIWALLRRRRNLRRARAD